jgi:hypothetical protein
MSLPANIARDPITGTYETKTQYERTLRRRAPEVRHAYGSMNPSHKATLGKHVANLRDASSRRDWHSMDSAIDDLDQYVQQAGSEVDDLGGVEVDRDVAKMGELRVRLQRLDRWMRELP